MEFTPAILALPLEQGKIWRFLLLGECTLGFTAHVELWQIESHYQGLLFFFFLFQYKTVLATVSE